LSKCAQNIVIVDVANKALKSKHHLRQWGQSCASSEAVVALSILHQPTNTDANAKITIHVEIIVAW